MQETLDFVRQRTNKACFLWGVAVKASSKSSIFATTVPLVAFLSLFFFFYFNFIPSCVFTSSFSPVAPHGTRGNNGSLTTFAESLWTWWLGNVSRENNTKGQFSIFPPVRLRFADTAGLVISHIYYASHAAYDLAPVELALTRVIWQWIKV